MAEYPGWLLRQSAGRYHTEDGRYLIERDDAFARVCPAPHPVMLPRDDWSYDPHTADWVRSYRCPGDVMHRHARWQIIDTTTGDYLTGTAPGEFTTLTEAAHALGFTGPPHHYVRRSSAPTLPG
ncbi:MAG: hypothetical protein ACRDRL_27220 [Sciscionella sp.]